MNITLVGISEIWIIVSERLHNFVFDIMLFQMSLACNFTKGHVPRNLVKLVDKFISKGDLNVKSNSLCEMIRQE